MTKSILRRGARTALMLAAVLIFFSLNVSALPVILAGILFGLAWAALTDIIFEIIFALGGILYNIWCAGGITDGCTKQIIDPFYAHFQEYILLNPDISNPYIKDLMLFFIHILEPFYLVILLAAGVYLLLMSGSERGRAKVKSLLPKIVLTMLLIPLSYFILLWMLQISHAVTASILSSADPNLVKDTFEPGLKWMIHAYTEPAKWNLELPVIYILMPCVLPPAVVTFLSVRFVMIIFFSAVFPLSIVLYTLESTRPIGRMMIEKTFLWIFAQVGAALTLMVVAATMPVISKFFPESGLVAAVCIGGLLAVVVVPLMIVFLFNHFLP